MQNRSRLGKITLVKTSPENKALKDSYAKAFVRRVKVLREASGRTAEEVAKDLNVKLDTYYRYESKVVMPHFLIPRFLVSVDGDARYLLGLSRDRSKARLKTVD